MSGYDWRRRRGDGGRRSVGMGVLLAGVLAAGFYLGGCDAALSSAVEQAMIQASTGLIEGAWTDWANQHTATDNTTGVTDNSTTSGVSVSGNTINLPTTLLPDNWSGSSSRQ